VVEAKVRRMSVFKNGKFYHYESKLDRRRQINGKFVTGVAGSPEATVFQKSHLQALALRRPACPLA
jgi:hypothetical protein